MRKDSIDSSAIEKAYLIFSERGMQTIGYDDFSHEPTDYKKNTVEEPENGSKLRQSFKELAPANVMQGDKYEDLKAKSDSLNLRIDEQQNKLRVCRMRGNFQEFHRCMSEMQDMIKERERLDAKMAVSAPGGNAGQQQMTDYNRTYDQHSSYSEIQSIGEQIASLEERMREFLGE